MTTTYSPALCAINEVALEAERAGVGIGYTLICRLLEAWGVFIPIEKRRELVKILAEKEEA